MSKKSHIHAVFSSHIENSMITLLPTCTEPPCDPHPPLGTLPVLNTRQSKQTTKEVVSASLHLKRPSQKQNHQVEILCPHSTAPSLQQMAETTTSNFQHSPPIHQQSHPVPPNATSIRRSHTHPLTRALQLSVIPTTSHSTGRPTETRYLYLDRQLQCDAMRSNPIRTAHHPVQGSGRGTGRYSLENKFFGLLRRVRREVVQYLHMCRRMLVGWLVGCHDPSQKNKWIKGRKPP